MSGTVDPAVFIREFLSSFLESRLLQGQISTDEYHDHFASLRRDRLLSSVSQELFEKSPEPVNFERYGPLRLIYLREPDGTDFPFLQGLIRKGSPPPRRLTCFVGHRFLKNIETMLVCEYIGSKKRVPDTGSVPSDLQGLLRIQYRSYQELARQLHFRLPAFLKENGLRVP